MVRLLYPMAPHFAEELWQQMGFSDSLVDRKWIEWDSNFIESDEVSIVIQVNGKVRSQLVVDSDSDQEKVKEAALADSKVKSYIEGKEIRKVIVVPKKLVNIVV
jgi:leucyl-tRNA synthetase